MPIIGSPVAPDPEVLILDPVTEDAANSELVISTSPYGLLEHHYPQPPIIAQWATSVDTEGSRLASVKHDNRQIQIVLDVEGLDALRDLQAKLGKLHREGGTLQRTLGDGTVIVFDVLTAEGYDPAFDLTFTLGGILNVQVTLTCLPYGRGIEETVTSHPETTLAYNTVNVTGVKGDMSADGRLVITDAQGAHQRWAMWALQSRYYDSAATAALFYEAEGRTRLGGASIVTATAPASGGASNNAVRATLTTAYQGVLSTQANGGGAHLTHVGGFRLFARVMQGAANTGTVTAGLQWAPGDFNNPVSGDTQDLDDDLRGTWVLLDLGLIDIPPVTVGSQRWEARVAASSTVDGDTLDIDYLLIAPTGEGYGEAAAVDRPFVPTSFVARDEFGQTAGALNGKTLPVGGTWVTSGTSATDFQVSGSGTATRTLSTAETNWAGRFAIAGSTSYTNVASHLEVSGPGDASTGLASTQERMVNGLILRWVDASNWLAIVTTFSSTAPANYKLQAIKNVAGVKTRIGSGITGFLPAANTGGLSLVYDATVLDTGAFSATLAVTNTTSGAVDYSISGSDTTLATGGVLATGKPGFYSEHGDSGGAGDAYVFDNFRVAVPPIDAAIYASQSLQVGGGSVLREDSTGTVWARPSIYEGTYLRVPPAGAEGRTTRLLAKATRFDPRNVGDIAIDDLTIQLFYTPRYLVVPSA